MSVANKQIVFQNAARDLSGGQTFDFIIIDGGLSATCYIRNNATGDAPANASQITSAGGIPIIAPSGGGDVVGVGTTGKLPLWTDGPNSVQGDSIATQTGVASITIAGDAIANDFLFVGGGASGLYRLNATTVIVADDAGLAIGHFAPSLFRIQSALGAGLDINVPSDGNVNLTVVGGPTLANLTTGSVTLGAVSSATGQLKLANSASAFLTTIQAGNAAAARTYTWPTNFGAAGAVLTDAAGNGTLSWAAPAAGITINTTTITGGTTLRLLFDNAGTVGEISGLTSNGSTTLVQTSNAAAAFESGPNGSTNPCFRIVNNTASAVNGISITGSATGAITANFATIGAIGSDANVSLKLAPKGNAHVYIDVPASSNGALILGGTNLIGFTNINTNVMGFQAGSAGAQNVGVTSTGYALISSKLIKWTDAGNDMSGTFDTGLARNAAGIVEVNSGTAGTLRDLKTRDVFTNDATFLIRTNTALTNNAAAQTATLLNSPTAGNPSKWIGIDDNGVTRFIPAW